MAVAGMNAFVVAPLDPWEQMWAPYDEATYATVLAAIGPDDVVLELGAGDLRLARRLALAARRVIAWELHRHLLDQAPCPHPPNLTVHCTDARRQPIPAGITTAVLLMRHCQHFGLYVARLRAAGCQRLITNARWRTGVEVIDLGPGLPFAAIAPGWWACKRCGQVGFTPIAPDAIDQIDAAALDRVSDVEGCPACRA